MIWLKNLEEAKHIIDAGFHHIKHIVINHHIIENDLPNQEYIHIPEWNKIIWRSKRELKERWNYKRIPQGGQ